MGEDEGRPAHGTNEPAGTRATDVAGRPSESRARNRQPQGESLGDMHSYIGSRLRQAFDDIASQPVPDRFLQLMQDLDKA